MAHNGRAQEKSFRSRCLHEEGLIADLYCGAFAIRTFLALDTTGCPRHRSEPSLIDLFFAIDAQPENAGIDATECGSSLAEEVRFAPQCLQRQFAFHHVLYLVQCIRAGLDRDCFAVTGKPN